MLIKLALNEEKVKRLNEHIREMNRECPEYAFKEIGGLEEVFCPYQKFMRDPGWNKYVAVAKDHRANVELHGFYVCSCNSSYALKNITNYRAVENFKSPIYWCDYGVADNASQVLDYYEHLLKEHGDYMNDRKFIIQMTPIFRENQPECGGWRWHKWGMYIGEFEPKRKYLYDEQGIDYVWVFNILEVKEFNEEETQ